MAERAVWSVFVVVPCVGAEDGGQMMFADDQHSVGALPPDGAHPTFGERVRPERLGVVS